jgi:hypothetical protein
VLDNIPPTKEALHQHVLRSAYQAGQIWSQCLNPLPEVPSPSSYGWMKDESGDWKPVWTLLPEADKVCRELIKCNCKNTCTGRCKCKKSRLVCTDLCTCKCIP